MTIQPVVGISLKNYFHHEQAVDWLVQLRNKVTQVPEIDSGEIEFFVAPSMLQLVDSVRIFLGTTVGVCAQDVSAFDRGPYTGEVIASELFDIGVRYAEIGHAERRGLLGESDELVARKVAAAIENHLIPVLCVGEPHRAESERASEYVCEQVRSSLNQAPPGRVIIAYEPIWAIGAAEPATAAYVTKVTQDLRSHLASLPNREGSSVIYGGSAGPGLATSLGGNVDGLFLGRFGHDVNNVIRVIDEVSSLHVGGAEIPTQVDAPGDVSRHGVKDRS